MSVRISGKPIHIPQGVDVQLSAEMISAKGKLGSMEQTLRSDAVVVKMEDNTITVRAANDSIFARAMAGTTRQLIANLVYGVHEGFIKKLQLMGVGYRAQVKGKQLVLQLGLSHPVKIDIAEGLTVSCQSQTEVEVKGFNKQHVGQFAADIRKWRKPEPYKGKGIRYVGEEVKIKDAKK